MRWSYRDLDVISQMGDTLDQSSFANTFGLSAHDPAKPAAGNIEFFGRFGLCPSLLSNGLSNAFNQLLFK